LRKQDQKILRECVLKIRREHVLRILRERVLKILRVLVRKIPREPVRKILRERVLRLLREHVRKTRPERSDRLQAFLNRCGDLKPGDFIFVALQRCGRASCPAAIRHVHDVAWT
jgi:hypothetical protein